MNTTTSTPSPTIPTDQHPTGRVSRRITALVLAAPLTLGTAIAIHPQDTSDAASTLGRIAGDDRLRWTIAHLLEPFAWLLLVVVLLLAARLGSGRGAKLVRTGGVLAAVGAAASALIVYGHGEAYLFMSSGGIDVGAMEPLYARFHDSMPLAGPLSVGLRLGLLLLGIGLFRSRAVPRWVAVLIALVPLLMVPVAAAPPPLAAVIGVGPLVAALAGAAPAIATSVRRSQ